MRPAIILYNNNGNSLSVSSENTPGVGLLNHGSDGANAFILEVASSVGRQSWNLPLTEPAIVQGPAIIETICQSQSGLFISGFYLSIYYYETE